MTRVVPGVIVALTFFVTLTAQAELKSVEVGGKLEIYGAWYSDLYEPNGSALRIPTDFLPLRAIGPFDTQSAIRAGDGGNDTSFFSQRTRLHVLADFDADLHAFMEFDSIDTWGDDFRSDYLTGADSPAIGIDDLQLYQAYIEADHVFGLPLRLRIGRQEMQFGSGWLVGADPGPDPFVGMSFDALRLTYCQGQFNVDAWYSKLAENSPIEQDGDVDFMGIYATYTESGDEACTKPFHLDEAIFPGHIIYHALRRFGPFRGRLAPTKEKAVFDAYWMWVRDGRSLNDTDYTAVPEWIENLMDFDDYNVTNLHVFGARAAGNWDALDWEVEAAYEMGDAGAAGALFIPGGMPYGDDHAQWDAWAGHTEFGYTFKSKFQPRLYVGGAYYGGEDNRDISFRQWLRPFTRRRASLSFNRLFSSWREENFIDSSAMTNFWKADAGVTVHPTGAIELGLNATYLQTVAPFNSPVTFRLGRYLVPIAPDLSFWTNKGAKGLGTQVTAWMGYDYSADLSFELGWSHYFVGKGIKDGAFIDANGLAFVGGRGDNDADYVYFLTTVTF